MFDYIPVEFGDFIKSDRFFEYPSLNSDVPSQVFSSYDVDSSQSTDVVDYLVAFSTTPSNYCVGCVDMVNSTKISSKLTQSQLPQYYEIFLNSMSRIIGGFGGHIIKNVGDCLLYYFPKSTNSIQNTIRKYLECGLVMTEAHPIINKLLESKGLPKLNYRVSSDYGSVAIMNISNSNSVDLIGPPVNICAKINSFAKQNEFVIGGDLREIAKNIDVYKFEEIGGYDSGFPSLYSVYSIKRK